MGILKRARYFLRNTFGFSRSEINGTIILIGIILISSISTFMIPFFIPVNHYEFTREARYLDSVVAHLEANEIREVAYTSRKPPAENIEKSSPPKRKERGSSKQIKRFNLNEADSIELRIVRGIGKVLSARIVKYRDLLGGFVNYNQLSEVYGLSEEVIAELKKYFFIGKNFNPNKIKINYLSAYELSRHPYIDYQSAKIIIAYRNQHGFYSGVESLAKVSAVAPELIQKISPYIDFHDQPAGQ